MKQLNCTNRSALGVVRCLNSLPRLEVGGKFFANHFVPGMILILLMILQSCNEPMVKLGQSLIVKDAGSKKILIPSGELVVKVDTVINQVKYTLGIKDDIVVFISSIDGDATRIQGVKDRRLSQLKDLSNSSLQKINGWGYYLPIGNGWFAGFCNEKSIDNNKMPDWYFKYNFPKENKYKFKSIDSSARN